MRTPPLGLVSWIFAIISIYSSLFGHVSVNGQCLSNQQSLLLQLKHTLIFDANSSKILVQWNPFSDCCTWPGITCDQEGHVTALKLSEEWIFGGFDEHSSLFNLIHLKSLDFSYNDFNSAIPSSIGNLSSLTYLNFSVAGFCGQVPKEISLLTKLLILDLSNRNYLTNPESSNLRMVVQNLTHLEELYLDGVNLSTSRNEWGHALLSLPNLRVLSLTACSLSGPIDQSLAKLQFLSVLQLDYNDLSSLVPQFFSNFSNLTRLSLSNCGLSGTFPKGIFQVQTLEILDISSNPLLDGSFSVDFPLDSHLQSLVVSMTNFRGTIPATIGNLQHLSTLNLADCRFSGPLPKSITNLTQLVSLRLYNNNFTGPIPSLHMSKNLTEINLSSNRFMGSIPSAAHWKGLRKLVYIYLHGNSFDGNIPSSLFALPSIEMVVLSYNQFSGQLHEFPNAPSSLLNMIDLSGNELQGPIPMSIFKLSNLGHLSLSFNRFNGTIQLDMIIQNLINLYYLDLSYNNLSVNASANGTNFFSVPSLGDLGLASCKLRIFPHIIKNLPELCRLDLSSNQISGEIPNWVWKVGSGSLSFLNLSHNHLVGMQEPYSLPNYLDTIDLSFNKLHGKIPILPPNAYYLDFSSNGFTSIPSDIGISLSNVHYFSLSNNGLTGSIPESMCNASLIKVLDLSKNSLNGRIPTCLLALSHNFGLSLRRNNLSGSIPDAFPINCSLNILDLDGNLLTGRIPKSLANCKALEVLNLGNNQMIDTFPLLLKNISTLRVLVLQSNKFYGQITCGESIGAWPEIEIMNVGSNNFSGELPGQCLTNWHAMVIVKDDAHLQLNDTRIDEFYYEAGVRVTNKGLDMEFLKIPKGFTCIDFSSNNFHGKIPKELGQLKLLMVLNLSNNALSGHIPPSFGNLQQLESLDLSRNRLNGEIPASLSNLNFLSVLNLSYNQLVGRIPKGNQIQTFSADCFQGNEGLWGPPLTPYSRNNVPETPDEAKHSNSGSEIKWDLIGVEVGFAVGFGTVIGPLVFSARWRKRYFDLVEDAAYRVLPNLLLRKWLAWKMGIRN